MAADKVKPKKQIRPKMKAQWETAEYREKQLKSGFFTWTPERLEAARQRMIARMNTPEAKESARKRMAEFNKTERAKQSRSKSSAANWRNTGLRSRMLTGMIASKATRLKVEEPNDCERRCYAFLDELGIKYEPQFPIRDLTVVDAFVASSNTCIYFDSEYWHSIPENIRRDERITNALQDMGFAVLRIRCDRWARKINSADLAAVRTALCA